MDSYVFIHSAEVPSASVWQAALDRLGLDLHLDQSIDSRSHTGFWPAKAAGHDTGFEFFAGPISDWFGGPVPAQAGGRDWVVDLVTHSDMQELQAAMYAAAGLAEGSNGMVFDETSGGILELAAFLQEAQAIPLDG